MQRIQVLGRVTEMAAAYPSPSGETGFPPDVAFPIRRVGLTRSGAGTGAARIFTTE
jgi:hypothetical protein